MSGITALRPYFRTQLNALGYKEWPGGFSFDNIPSTLLDGAYHIETIDSARRGPWSQQTQDIEFPVTIRVFLKGYRDVSQMMDDALSEYDSILTRVLDPTRRLTSSIKNIFPERMKLEAVAATNDNDAILEITFNCLIIFA